MTTPFEPTPLGDSEYHAITSAILSRIEATVDQWLQDDVVDIDTHRTGGLLELSFPTGSKIVINTQPPLHERIRMDVEKLILSGRWPPGSRIPVEHELERRYGCVIPSTRYSPRPRTAHHR